MISLTDIWSTTWGTKLVSLLSTVGVPALVVFGGVIAPILLAPLLVTVFLFLSLTIFSLINQHQVYQKSVPDYNLQLDTYVLLKWAAVHAGVASAVLPFAYIMLSKLVPIPIVPLLGSCVLVYLTFVFMENVILSLATKELS